MPLKKHSYQWEHTENAFNSFYTLVSKYVLHDKDRLHKFFLQNSCFFTEKFDGTNVAKDEKGNIYSRRLVIDAGQKEFIKTSLKKVKEANVVEFKTKLIEAAKLEENMIEKCLVYGELICNGFYDYKKRNLMGKWVVFGAVVQLKKDSDETLEKLLKVGFAAAKKTSNQIQLFTNEKFIELVKKSNLEYPEIRGKEQSIAQAIMKNKDDMKKGLLEGLVLTIYDEENGYRVVKWKGAHEWQPASEEKLLKANDMIQNADVHEDIKNAFGFLTKVISDTSENKLMVVRAKKQKKNTNNHGKSKQNGKYLSNEDKEIILQGTFHSQKKFDCVEEYARKGEDSLKEYTDNLVTEVRKHLAEEKDEFVKTEEDDNIMAFIKHKVTAIIKSQLAGLEE